MNTNSNIVALDAYTMNPGDLDHSGLSALGDLTIFDRTTDHQVIDRAQNADIVITNKVVFDQKIIDQLPNLKYICVSATGYNIVDVVYARSKNILVSNVAGYAVESVTEHVFSMIFALIKSTAKYDLDVKNGRWLQSKDFSFWDDPITTIAGSKMGIIGFGQIGQQVAKVADAFGMEVFVHHYKPVVAQLTYSFVDLETIWSECDYISLHIPLNSNTEHIVNADSLSKMKSNCILINTARGGHVDENALYQALQSKQIRAAGLDVMLVEPPKKKSKLYELDNCMITPHQAWASDFARKKLLNGVINNIQAFLNNKPINLVN